MFILDVVVTVVVTLLLGLLLLIRFESTFVDPTIPFSAVSKLQTGDLLFFRASPAASLFACAWVHVGLVIRVVGKTPFIFEIRPGRPPTVTPVKRRIVGTTLVAVRHCRSRVSCATISATVSEFKTFAYEHSYWIPWVNRMCRWLPLPERPARRHTYCSDLVIRVAAAAGLIPAQRSVPFPNDMVSSSWYPDVWGGLARVT